MTIYKVKLTFDTFLFEADLSQASAPIRYAERDQETGELVYQATPYQTADAGHDATTAAVLMVRWMGTDYYLEPGEEVGDDLDEYIRQMIVSVDRA